MSALRPYRRPRPAKETKPSPVAKHRNPCGIPRLSGCLESSEQVAVRLVEWLWRAHLDKLRPPLQLYKSCRTLKIAMPPPSARGSGAGNIQMTQGALQRRALQRFFD